jgi:hypothetical protein
MLIGFLSTLAKTRKVDVIVLNKVRSTGSTALILHVGGFIGCVICVLRSIDPFPVLGVYNYKATDLLSHIGVAVLLTTVFEAISAMVSKVFINFRYDSYGYSKYFLKTVRFVSFMTFTVAIVTWVVENYITDVLMYSAGVYFTYGTCIQWTIFVLYLLTLRQIANYCESIKDTITSDKMHALRSMIRKLQFIKYMFFVILSILTGYQTYTTVNQIRYKQTIEKLDSDEYTFPNVPVFTTQVVSYTILLYFSYIKPTDAGNQKGFSDASAYKESSLNTITSRIIPGDIPLVNTTSVREIIVKFKDEEMDPKIKVLDSEALKRSSVKPDTVLLNMDRLGKIDSVFKEDQDYRSDGGFKDYRSDRSDNLTNINDNAVDSDINYVDSRDVTPGNSCPGTPAEVPYYRTRPIPNTENTVLVRDNLEANGILPTYANPYETYTSYSESSNDSITPEQLEILLKCMDEQEAAERAGKLDEYLAKKEAEQYVAFNTNDVQLAADYLNQQIIAMKQEERKNAHYNKQVQLSQSYRSGKVNGVNQVDKLDDIDDTQSQITQSSDTYSEIIARIHAKDYLAKDKNLRVPPALARKVSPMKDPPNLPNLSNLTNLPNTSKFVRKGILKHTDVNPPSLPSSNVSLK